MTKKTLAVESTVLLSGADGVADSKILKGFRSPIEAEAITRARAAGYAVCAEYLHAGEFGIDVTGETGEATQPTHNGRFLPETAKKLLSGEITAALSLDSNGAPRRIAATNGLINLKPTYGTVSRYGVLPIAASADTVSITATVPEECEALLSAVSGQDEKDATTVRDTLCPAKNGASPASVRRVGVPSCLLSNLHDGVKENISAFVSALNRSGVETVDIQPTETDILTAAHAAWNTVLCAELWGNLSRYDGVRYGRRAKAYGDIGEMYTANRSEGFGSTVKNAILYGSFALSPDSDGAFFKANEARKMIKAEAEQTFSQLDAILLPACSVPFYTPENFKMRQFTAFNENFYTAFASLCGLPAVTAHSVQIVGKPYSDMDLLNLLKITKF